MGHFTHAYQCQFRRYSKLTVFQSEIGTYIIIRVSVPVRFLQYRKFRFRFLTALGYLKQGIQIYIFIKIIG